MKQIRFLLAVLMAFVFTARAWAQTEEAYAVLNKGRLSFYYDESKNTQTGTVFPIPWEGDQPGWTKDDYPASITRVSFTPSFKSYDGLTTTSYMFVDLQNITSLDLSYLNTDNVIDMSSMFAGCKSLEKIKGLDCTTNVKDMSRMFYLCESMTSLDLSGLNTSNVTNMSYMFANSGVTSLDLSGFDTGNVTDMSSMLSTCRQLTDVNLSSFNTENVVNMSGMFYQSDQLRVLDLTNFNIESVTDIRWMFALATNLRVIYCDDDWNIPGKSVNSDAMFQSNLLLKGAVDFDENKSNDITYANPTTGYFTKKPLPYAVLSTDLKTLTFYYDALEDTREGTTYPIPWKGNFPGWYNDENPTITTVDFHESFANYHGLTNAQYMFHNQKVLTTINHIERLHTEHVTTMYGMFYYCYKLRELDLSTFDTSNVTDMDTMFGECKELASLDVSNFNTASVTSMHYMFYGCENLKSLNLTSFNTSEVENMEHMFDYCISLTTIYCNDDWSKGKVKHSDCMFDRCSQLKGAISYDPYSGKEDVTYANPTTGYFTGSEAYAVVDEEAHTLVFYYDINKSTREGEVIPIGDNDWYLYEFYTVTVDSSMANCHSLTSTKGMFSHMEFVDEIIGLEYLNTENVTNMSGMFNGSYQLQSLDLSNFNTSKVTDMSYMFSDCGALTTIYCYDNWQKNGLSSDYMFYGCSALIGAAAYDGTKIGASMANPDTGYFSRYDQVAIDEINFPDDNFRAWILQQSYGQDGILTLAEANDVTQINVDNKQIADLTGIMYFSELTSLSCRTNRISSLDLSYNTKIKNLDCADNRLASLNMTGCAPTTSFKCFTNLLEGEAMDAFISSLPTVTATSRPSIGIYYEGRYERNRLTQEQIYNLLNKGWVPYFFLDGDAVSFHIDNPGDVPVVKYNFPDDNFRAWIYNQSFGENYILSSEEIAGIKTLDVHHQNISDLTGIELFTALTTLICYGNSMTTLDVSQIRDLETLLCYSCDLITLDVSQARSLKKLVCSYNQLTSLIVGDMNGSLEDVNCSHNQLTSLDVSECPALTYLYCGNNQITGEAMGALVGSLPDRSQTEGRRGFLDVVNKNSTAEQNVITMAQAAVADEKKWEVYGFDIPIDEEHFPDEMFRNQISQDFGEDEVLSPLEIVGVTGMNIENWGIVDITGIEYFTELQYLTCVGRQVTTLDVSQNTKLLELSVEENHLTALDVSNNPDLRFISVYGNNIHGAAMSAFVESLPTVEGGELYIWDESEDGNVITVDQVALAKAKGWAVLDRGGYDYAGVPVEKGDANGDGELTIDDAVAVANSIIGQTSDIFNSTAADVNNDGEVTIADATAIIGILAYDPTDDKMELEGSIQAALRKLEDCKVLIQNLEQQSGQTQTAMWDRVSEIEEKIAAVKTDVQNAKTRDDIQQCRNAILLILGELTDLMLLLSYR